MDFTAVQMIRPNNVHGHRFLVSKQLENDVAETAGILKLLASTMSSYNPSFWSRHQKPVGFVVLKQLLFHYVPCQVGGVVEIDLIAPEWNARCLWRNVICCDIPIGRMEKLETCDCISQPPLCILYKEISRLWTSRSSQTTEAVRGGQWKLCFLHIGCLVLAVGTFAYVLVDVVRAWYRYFY